MAVRVFSQMLIHATRWLVNEVNLHKAWQAGQRHPLRLGKLWRNAQRGRFSMHLTQHQRETGQEITGSVRGQRLALPPAAQDCASGP